MAPNGLLHPVRAGGARCAICDGLAEPLPSSERRYPVCDRCSEAYDVGLMFEGHEAYDQCDDECREASRRAGVCRHGVPEDYLCLRYVAEVMVDPPVFCSDDVAVRVRRRLRSDEFRRGGVCQCRECCLARAVVQ